MKIFTLMAALLLSSCITHKDLAQIQANAFETTVQYHTQQKLELYVQRQINRWFMNEFMNGRPYVELLDVTIIQTEDNGPSDRLLCNVVMITERRPYVVTEMTVDVLDNFEGVGQFSFNINPWE